MQGPHFKTLPWAPKILLTALRGGTYQLHALALIISRLLDPSDHKSSGKLIWHYESVTQWRYSHVITVLCIMNIMFCPSNVHHYTPSYKTI